MAVSFAHFTQTYPRCPISPSPASSSLSISRSRSSRMRCSASVSPGPPQMSSSDDAERRRFMEFPYSSSPIRDLMVDLVSTAEARLGSDLHPCTLPPDVRFPNNQSRTTHASLYIRSAIKPSQVDFILGSWLHSKLPSGGALNITSFSGYLSSATDAPNFFMDLIQSSPKSLVLILDLPPRKDLVLHPDYLHAFYEDTQLDKHRQLLQKLPEVQPYYSPSLYIRSLISPTAILVSVLTEAGGEGRMEEILRDQIGPIAKELLAIWLDRCACAKREVEEAERDRLEKRDQVIRRKSMEIDLGSSFPRLFGQEIAARVLGVMREVFGV